MTRLPPNVPSKNFRDADCGHDDSSGDGAVVVVPVVLVMPVVMLVVILMARPDKWSGPVPSR